MSSDAGFRLRLREARKRLGLSGRALDVRAGLGQGHTSMIETGQRKDVTIETLRGLAHALGVSLDWLVDGTESGTNVANPPDPSTGTHD